jgi:hypothetical protein
MATKADFTEAEWEALRKGITGTGMLVSLSDRDFTDTFGEVGAIGKYLAGQQVAAASPLVRELTHGSTGFGLTASPEKVRAETMEALATAVATLQAKAPDELEAYRGLVLGVADVVAQAKGGGVAAVEASMIEEVRAALGAA